MKITKLVPWLVKAAGTYWGEYFFVEVRTDEGVTGWGEITTTTKIANRAVAGIIRQLNDLLVGEDPSGDRVEPEELGPALGDRVDAAPGGDERLCDQVIDVRGVLEATQAVADQRPAMLLDHPGEPLTLGWRTTAHNY